MPHEMALVPEPFLLRLDQPLLALPVWVEPSMTRDTYDADVVLAFVAACSDCTGLYLNGVRLDSNQRQKLERWAGYETIPMHRVDSFLMRHGLMLFELEEWALDNPAFRITGFNSDYLASYY